MKIKVKYFNWLLPKITKIRQGDWIDLRCAEDTWLNEGEFRYIPLGVGMILPEGYEAHVVPRSSTFLRFGILMVNSIGIIDNSYSGDNDQWMFPALAMRPTFIAEGDRIAQFRIVKNQPDVDIVEVEKLNSESRGGLGSTGE